MQNTLAKITMLSLVSALTLTACDKKTDSTDNAGQHQRQNHKPYQCQLCLPMKKIATL